MQVGFVTRSVMGNPDNDANYFAARPDIGMPNTQDFFAFSDYKAEIQAATRETQPDHYYYNFAGQGGKYVVRPNKEVLKKEKNNLKITHVGTGGYPVIIDESGVTYDFSETETTRMDLNDDNGSDPPAVRHYNFVSSWYLSSMTSADQEEQLVFEYYATTGEQQIFQNMNNNKSVSQIITSRLDGPPVTTYEGFTATPPDMHVKRKYIKRISLLRSGTLIAYVDIESVAGQRLDKTFPEDRMVQRIKTYSHVNGVDKLVKQYDFFYGYFTRTQNLYSKYRLRLDSIKEIPVTANTSYKPPYAFTYDEAYPMPDFNSAGLDHWGFYNGASNTSLVPSIEKEPGVYVGDNANREPSKNAASFTILQKIKYPTGGYTTFEYELNRIVDPQSNNNSEKDIGGLRIKRMIDYSFETKKAIAKTYAYTGNDGLSSGATIALFPKYDYVSTYTCFCSSFTDPYDTQTSNFTVSATSVFGLGSIQGSHIGYRQVTEYQNDVVTDKPLGKTVYNYKVGVIYENNDDISNGDLEKKSIYDNKDKLLYELTNTYSYTQLDYLAGLKIVVAPNQNSKTLYCKRVDGSGNVSYTRYKNTDSPTGCVQTKTYKTELGQDIYAINYQEKKLIEQTEKTYDQLSDSYLLNSLTNTYGNPDHTYPTMVTQLTSGQEKVVTTNKYAQDYTLPPGISGLDAKTLGIRFLKVQNIHGIVIEKLQYRQKQDGTNTRYVDGQITNYANGYPVSIDRLETATPLTSVTASAANTGTFVYDSHFKPLGYFKYGAANTLIEQGKDKDAPKAYVWDYNNSYPVAEATNAVASAIAYSGFETDIGYAASGWGMTGITANTTYAFTGRRSANLLTGAYISKLYITAPDGKLKLSYWSRSGAVTVLQNNANTISVAFTGAVRNGWTYYEHLLPAGTQQVKLTATSAIIDELRLFPVTAQMTTYSYDPLVGVTSQVSATNLVNYYAYDGLNRLINVKDEKGSIVKDIRYNYGPGTAVTASATTIFYNAEAEQSFTKNNCTVAEPTTLIYKVPYGKYVSSISQADADGKAQSDISTNGQAYANTNGECLFYNTEVFVWKFKDDCLPAEGLGSRVKYTVTARKYSSAISQADADAKAQQDLDNNAQAYANAHGTCSCDAEGQKMVNGACEMGTKLYDTSVLQPNGQYKCTYRYHFSDGSTSQTYTSYSSTPCPVI